MGSPGKPEQKRTRITFEVDDPTSEQVRAAAAGLKGGMGEYVRALLLAHLDAEHMEELQSSLGPPPPGVEETPIARRSRFLEALEELFAISRACRVTQIPNREVQTWLAEEDREFACQARFAQEAHIESVEAQLVAVGLGRIKGNVLALIAFLNAHHKAYGRQKVEAFAQFIGKVIEEFYEIAIQEAGQAVGERLIARFKERGEAILAKFSE